MTVHLTKVAVGVESIDHLRTLQAGRIQKLDDGQDVVVSYTGNTPKRRDELIAGGSIFWIIKRQLRVRQAILDLQTIDWEGKRKCLLMLDPTLVMVSPQPKKPHQGWRYMAAEDAPTDLGGGAFALPEMPEQLAADLRRLCLI